MRTIHVLRVEGIDEATLANIFHEELKVIHNTDPHPENPEKYKDFNFKFALLLFVPITTLSGDVKSLIASPSLKNSGWVTQATPLSSINAGSLNCRGVIPSSNRIILLSFSSK